MSRPSGAREAEKSNRTMIFVVGIMVALAVATVVYLVSNDRNTKAEARAARDSAAHSAAEQSALMQSAADQAALNVVASEKRDNDPQSTRAPPTN